MKLLVLCGRSSVAAPSREEHYALQERRPRRTVRTGSLLAVYLGRSFASLLGLD